jgi:hypothetical protein
LRVVTAMQKNSGVASAFFIDAHAGIAAVRCAQVEISNP